MISIIKNEEKEVIFFKDDEKEKWFDDHCSDENLLKILKREEETIDHIQWKDGIHIADHLHIYFK
jgi:hypothetical protein